MMIEGEHPSTDNLGPVFTDSEDRYSNGNTHYLIEKELLDDKYFWLHARYGKSIPHSDTVYDTKELEEQDNPRSTNQVEPVKQLFFLYCTNSNALYLSDMRKKLWVAEYLQSKLGQDVVVKNFLDNVEEFMQQVKRIEKIKLVTKRDLFTSRGSFMDIFPVQRDLLGLGEPAKFTLDVNFERARLNDRFIAKFKELVNYKDSGEVDSLVCVGRDDSNFETIFNVDSFIQKVSVEVEKDEQEFYDPTTVQRILIRKI